MITERNKQKRQSQMTLPLKVVLSKIKSEVLGNGLSYSLKERKYLIFW
jgi:hypothetical protein